MQDTPTPPEILTAVAALMRNTVMPELTGHTAFLVRVAANAVDLVRRQIELESHYDQGERERLMALLHQDDSLENLNRSLCAAIEAHSVTAETPGLADHLWATTLAKLAIDQPNYAAYRQALHSAGTTPAQSHWGGPGRASPV